MKAAIALTIVLSLGCVSASPTLIGKSVAAASSSATASSSSSSAQAYSSSYSASSTLNYYSSDVCTAVGFTIRDDLATCIFDELEQQFLQKKCELLNSYGVYPGDIGPRFCDMSPDSLYYDIIVIGSGPAGLGALPSLAALGKKILIVDKGYFAPAAADSLYYRTSLYASEYVNSFPGYINGVEVTKNLYTSNVFGGLSVLDTNTWNIGGHSLYDQLATINDEFTWEKIYTHYKGLESYKSYSRSVSVTTSSTATATSTSSASSGSSSASSTSSSSTTTSTTTTYEYSTSGLYSIYNSYQESFLTRTLSSVFDELGYSNCDSPFNLQPNKYSILPCLGDRDRPLLFPYTVFQNLEQYKNNIDLALRTTAKKINFDGNKATSVDVITPSGQQITVYANDQVILSTGLISTYELLINSGCGPQELLNQYNIPVSFPIPSLGSGVTFAPVYHGVVLKFPKGYLMDNCDSDLRNLAYAFGDYEVSSSLALNYYRAYLAVKGAPEANVALKFYAFGQSTSIRLRNMMSSYFQYDSYTQEYINSLINDYDILIVGTQLLAPKSRGLITYKDCIDKPYIDLGLYSDEYDIECMLEAIDQIKALAQTKPFLDLNGELVQFPLQSCTGDFFTPEFNKQSLYYHSTPSLYGAGGFPIGIDYQTAVLDKALRVLGTENLRILNTHVSPYPLGADSLAFSTFIGSYAAEVIANEYQGTIFPYIPLDNINTAVSASASSTATSYSSRDIGSDVDSATATASSTAQASSGSTVDSTYPSGSDVTDAYATAGACAHSTSDSYGDYPSGSDITNTYAAADASAHSVTGSNGDSYATSGASAQTVSGSGVSDGYGEATAEANAVANASSDGGYGATQATANAEANVTSGSGVGYDSTQATANAEASATSESGASGYGAQSYSATKASSESYQANQSNSRSVASGNGYVAQQSKSSYDAEHSASNMSATNYSSDADGVEASTFQASSQTSKVSATEESSFVAAC